MAVRKHEKNAKKSAGHGEKGMSVKRPERRAGHKPVGDEELPRRDDLIDPVSRRGEVPIAVEDQDPDRPHGRVPSVRDQGRKLSGTQRKS